MAQDIGIRMAYTPDVGRARQELYRGTYKRLKEAIEAGFWIEAIALCESIISDRLQARISHLKGHSEDARRNKMLGGLVRQIKTQEKQIGFEKLHAIYDDIAKWKDDRNEAVHRAVKLNVGETFRKWDEFYDALEQTAREGADICRRLTNEQNRIKRLDQRVAKKQ